MATEIERKVRDIFVIVIVNKMDYAIITKPSC